jgi:hypothetical protein
MEKLGRSDQIQQDPLSIGPSFFDHVCPLSSDNKHGWQRVCAGLGQCFMRESVARTHHDQCDSVINIK